MAEYKWKTVEKEIKEKNASGERTTIEGKIMIDEYPDELPIMAGAPLASIEYTLNSSDTEIMLRRAVYFGFAVDGITPQETLSGKHSEMGNYTHIKTHKSKDYRQV